MSGYWQDLTTADFAAIEREKSVALLPVAAVEQHGPHLPLGTDAIINQAIIAAMLARPAGAANVLVLPPLDLGLSTEHRDFAGTLTAAPATLIDLWSAAGASVARSGIDRLILFNSHGGQKSLVDIVATQLRAEHGLLVVRANYFSFGMPAGLFNPAEVLHGIHGGEVETSLMLHIAPGLVRREALTDFRGRNVEWAVRNEMLGFEKPAGIGWMSQDLHPDGATGNAAAADADRGAVYLEFLADRLLRLCAETVDPLNSPGRSSPSP